MTNFTLFHIYYYDPPLGMIIAMAYGIWLFGEYKQDTNHFENC